MLNATPHSLPRTIPEEQGLPSAAVLQFVAALDQQINELHSVMVLRHGSVVAEGWWAPYRASDRHAMFSVSKSFTSTAVGFAVSEGRLSLTDRVVSFFPNYLPAAEGEHLAAMTIRDLLMMATGHANDSWLTMIERSDGDWIKAFFDEPVVQAPGTAFLYNNGATHMLAAIMQRVTGMTLIDYLQPRLFEPLGIEGATWQTSPQGISVGAYGLSIRTEDMARFGQFYVQRGQWGGRRLLPEAWIEAATAVQIANGPSTYDDDSTQGYGYQFWRSRHQAYRASGVFGQYCVVMPHQEVVVAFTAGVDMFEAQQLLDSIWQHLLPAMHASPLAPNEADHAALAARLAGLALPLVAGQPSVPGAAQHVGRTFRFEANPLQLETLALEASPSGWLVRAAGGLGDDLFPCGYGVWERGAAALLADARWLPPGKAPVATSGAWTANDTLTMVVRVLETPFFYKLVFNFMGEEVLLEVQVNVTLDSPAPLVLIGSGV